MVSKDKCSNYSGRISRKQTEPIIKICFSLCSNATKIGKLFRHNTQYELSFVESSCIFQYSFFQGGIFMSFKMHFGHDIYHLRTDSLKLTQQQVADAIPISLREYQKIEKGELSPGSEIFLRLVFFFNIDIQKYREDL